MGSIFLSYAREDRGYAEKLAHVLAQAGHEVWWDRRLDGGEEFSAEIEAALNKSDVVLVAWSKQSVRSPWVRDEAAVGAETRHLVPVSIDGSLPPMGFRQFHTLDLSGWRGTKRDGRTAELLQSVNARLRPRMDPDVRPAELKNGGLAIPTGKLLWVAAAAVVLALIVGAGLFWQKERPDRIGPLRPTIALLPFTTASPDRELSTIGSQARDALAHTFSQSGVPLKVLDAVPQGRRTAPDFLMSGDLSRDGDKVVAAIRLDEVAHGVTVYSRRFEAGQDQAGDLPDRIGAQMAAFLTANDTVLVLDRRRPVDPALIADFLSLADYNSDPLQVYQQSKRDAAKAPDVQFTQLGVAFNTAFALGQLPREERAAAVAEGRRAADRAIALGPKFGDAYSPWCLLHSETLMAKCEDRLRAARRVDPDAPWLNTFLSHLLRGVGRFDEATQLAKLSQTHDVYIPQKIAWLLRVLEYSGESERSRQLYQQGARWWPDYKTMFFQNRLFGLLDRGDFEAIQRLEQDTGAAQLLPGYSDTGTLVAALKAKSPAAVRQACGGTGDLLKLRCMLALAIVGDQDGAYAIAEDFYPRRVGRTAAETERIWLDVPDGPNPEFITSRAAAPMRKDPRYLQIANRIGLLAYWRSGRLPDFCLKQPEPICAQLRRP